MKNDWQSRKRKAVRQSRDATSEKERAVYLMVASHYAALERWQERRAA